MSQTALILGHEAHSGSYHGSYGLIQRLLTHDLTHRRHALPLHTCQAQPHQSTALLRIDKEHHLVTQVASGSPLHSDPLQRSRALATTARRRQALTPVWWTCCGHSRRPSHAARTIGYSIVFDQGPTIPTEMLSKEYFTYYIILGILLGSIIIPVTGCSTRSPARRRLDGFGPARGAHCGGFAGPARAHTRGRRRRHWLGARERDAWSSDVPRDHVQLSHVRTRTVVGWGGWLEMSI